MLRLPPPGVEGFRDLTPCGEGGQASVFRAIRNSDGSIWAIKLYTPNTDPRRVDYEVTTFQNLETTSFPGYGGRGTATINGIEWEWLAFEFIEGESLLARLQREGRMDEAETRRLLCQVSMGLEDLWRLRKVHRDITPKNLMRRSTGDYIILDLGFARHLDQSSITGHGLVVGTQGYMSREHCSGRRHLTVKTDVFSLGVTAYEALTGIHPFGGWQRPILLAQPVDPRPLSDSATPPVRDLLLRMLAHDPAERPLPEEITRELDG